MRRTELKETAKANIKRQTGMMMFCSAIYLAIIAAVSSMSMGFIALLITGPLEVLMYYIFQKNADGEEIEYRDLIDGSKESRPEESFLLGLKVSIFTFLWSLLFIVPGIIKALSYSMSYYILMRDPELSNSEALDLSCTIMDGYKADLLVLWLSFFPWYLLVGVTFGIAGIWVYPYVKGTQTLFYQNLYENYRNPRQQYAGTAE